jgi:serine/threonine protein kinase
MVMDCAKGGNLREHLKRNANKLDLKKKLIQLHSIAEGLKDIHEKGLMHKDFHSGNILGKGTGVYLDDLICSITDLGLCRPANDNN